ncbi:MAG: TIGR00282 family metallophosphoesterase [Alphaproteobacteria bacterium]|nr:TIGR00282 family metallophosphoesterase [Alphaproteobacteria bacterium]
MKIIYCGDIVGRAGREAVLDNYDLIKQKYEPDVFIINGENAAHGFGITQKMCEEFFAKGIDAITTGNHAFRKIEILPYMDSCKKLIRPLNFPPKSPGKGFCEIELLNGRKILIVQLQGRIFMEPMDNPLHAIDNLLKDYHLGKNIHAIFVDIHAEATSEKLSVGYYLNGRVSAVVGTHTHVPTSDVRILNKGTAYQTDVGMCGDYDSVLGFNHEQPVDRLLGKANAGRLVPAEGKGTVCGIFIETDDQTGLAIHAEQVIIKPED